MTWRRNLVGLVTVSVLALAWYGATSATGLVSGGRFPSPADTLAAFRQISGRGYADGTLLAHALHSLRLVALGFAVAVATGVPLGLLMGWSRKAEALINPVFLLIRPIPPLAWIPLAILWLGLGDAAKIMVIWFAAFVPAVINSFAGVRTVERPLFEAARMLGTPALALRHGGADAGRLADDLHRLAAVASGHLDDARRGRARRRALRPWPGAQRRAAGHLSRHDPRRHGRCRRSSAG